MECSEMCLSSVVQCVVSVWWLCHPSSRGLITQLLKSPTIAISCLSELAAFLPSHICSANGKWYGLDIGFIH